MFARRIASFAMLSSPENGAKGFASVPGLAWDPGFLHPDLSHMIHFHMRKIKNEFVNYIIFGSDIGKTLCKSMCASGGRWLTVSVLPAILYVLAE
jgi:hypothetical protein